MKRAAILTSVLVALSFMTASATIINVPDDYETIQEGIDASTNGDTVLVQPGTYVENINFNGHNIVLGSMFLTTGYSYYISYTIIDGNSSGSVVKFESGENNNAVIKGFTLQNGSSSSYGGGIFCQNSDPVITDNIISLNTARSQGDDHGIGGGVFCDNSDATITNNTISENRAIRGQGFVNGAGGGIWCIGNSNPTISNNYIIGNVASPSFGGSEAHGGGVYCDNSNATITHNTISENEAYASVTVARGGGIACFGSSNLTISNNVISDNITWGEWDFGGGIYLHSSGGTISSNLITGHSVNGWGGGIFCEESSPTIINNTITGNSGDGGGISCWQSGLTIRNTILWANSGGQISYNGSSPSVQYCDVEGGWPGQGNIDCDPMFCDPENGDYYLDAASCCAGAGQGGVDIGAFGIGCHSPDIINIPGDYETIQEGIDASFDGDTVLVQPGTYVENIDFNGHNIVLGSMFLITGDDSYISTTIIDGNGSGSVVTFENGEDNAVVITGFTIQNGFSLEGGGIYCLSSDPTISYNIISGNSSESDGGGIYCDDSNPVIFRNTISGNSNYEGVGGGICCRNNSSPNIYGNTVSGNSTMLYGGAIFCFESSPGMTNNTISENSAGVSGGGIYCELVSNPIITNTIFWADNAAYSAEIDFDDSSSPYFTYCDIQGGWPGEGNIDTDPLFRDPDNSDFHLMATECGDVYDSPCIDAGHPEIHDDPLGCFWGLGAVVSDMGAYGGGDEATDCVYIPGDCNHNGTPLELEDALIIVGIYRGDIDPYYTCECPPHGSDFAPEADPNGNCIPFEIGDVVTEIAAYRGNDSVSGCEDCPGSLRLAPGKDLRRSLR